MSKPKTYARTTLKIVQRHFPNVTAVHDATKPLVIEVTKRDESTSRKRDYKECAMAVACKRTLKADGIIMARSTAYIVDGNTATRYHVPDSVAREIVSFDRGAGFQPGVYQLSKPAIPWRAPRKEKTGDQKRARKWTRHITTGIRAVLGGEDAQA